MQYTEEHNLEIYRNDFYARQSIDVFRLMLRLSIQF